MVPIYNNGGNGLQEDQIKMNLGELDDDAETKRQGKIKGLFRHSDKSSEIVENGKITEEAKTQNPNELGGLFVKQAVEKEEKTRSKARAAKRAERDAKYSKGSKDSDESAGTKKVYRRKGESRLVADRKRTGKVIHVSSKRSTTKESGEEY